MNTKHTAEYARLMAYRQRTANWKHWGPYLSERAWGTVREDYSAHGSAWTYFPHDHARSKAYRWNEDGLAGISDRNQYLCFALAVWNGHDPILKERLFGLTGPQGNHGEDVKEYYFYLDSTPTHSYMKLLYKYPQAEFPYTGLVEENARRGVLDFEYELLDTGVFAQDRYFDVMVEYAKASEDDILIQVTLTNRGPQPAHCQVLPTLWFRNTWGWGYPRGPMKDVAKRPSLRIGQGQKGASTVQAQHPALGNYYLYAESAPPLLFTENDTNTQRLYGVPNAQPYVKDAFHRYLIEGEIEVVNPRQRGTKVAAHYPLALDPGATVSVRLRLANRALLRPFSDFDAALTQRRKEADEFYEAFQHPALSADEKRVQRQAFAGMFWSKQLYYYDVEQWLNGDPGSPRPPDSRQLGRNGQWEHLSNFDILSMPDKWEYPWYAGWDLAFHCISLAQLDPDFAKRQLVLLTREWYMHPNGQIPAYEWAFGDANPPVHAWAAWRVYKIDKRLNGKADRGFLEGVFHKLLLNFTWWVNRKDEDDRNVFQGGFLGLDNISVFDRSAQLPTGGHIDQSDGTAWMGFYSLNMMTIALELAKDNPVYQDTATKFFEHYLRIAHAITNQAGMGYSLWDEEDGFFYDALHLPNDQIVPLKVRSLVGLMALIAVETLGQQTLDTMPDFHQRINWFVKNRPHLSGHIAQLDVPGEGQRRLLSFLTPEKLTRVLRYLLDESEFLSDYGVRSVSKFHEKHPYCFQVGNQDFTLNYQPAESQSGLFGGNSNWRGPVWFPINYLIIEALQKYHYYYGNRFKVECPTGSGKMMHLGAVSTELSRRLVRLFLRNDEGKRPIYGGMQTFQKDPHWQDLILFYEYFHGDNGAGLGASHQTGWTGLVAKLIQQCGPLC